MLWLGILCDVVLLLSYGMLCHVMSWYAVACYGMLCCVVLCHVLVWYGMV